MIAKNRMKHLLCAALLFVVAGCGGGDTGGGVAMFKTVYVNKPQITTSNPFISDLAIWSDTNADGKTEVCGADNFTIVNDFASTDVKVTPASSTISPSAILVETGEISFRHADSNTPELPQIYKVQPIAPNVLILPGETKSISVEIVNHALKEFIAGQILCTDIRWNYYVKISYNLVEISTGERKTIETEMLVRFFDVQ